MLKRIGSLLSPKEKGKFLVLVGQMIMVALLEFVGIALVLPFIRFAGGQMDIDHIPTFLSDFISKTDQNNFIVTVGFIIFSLIVITTILKIYLAWREQKFVWNLSHNLSIKQHKNILSKPFVFFIEKNSSEIITNLIVETSTTVRGVILPIAQIISNLLIAILFLGLVTLLHPKISLILLSISFIVGAIIIVFLKDKLSALGKKRLLLERSRFLQLKESIRGIKTVKSNSKEAFFLHKFEEVSNQYSKIKPLVNTLNSVPRFAMDILLFGGVVLLVSFIVLTGDDVAKHLPTLTFYVLVGFKLLPTFQNIINAIITIRFSYPSTLALYEGLHQPSDTIIRSSEKRIPFDKTIKISNCSFSHIENENVIKNVSLTITKGQRIGIVGYSGSGKTTLVEIIAGLLFPDKGSLKIDDLLVSKDNLTEHKNNIAFIPQTIFFFDDTLVKNITFEDRLENVNFEHLNSIITLLNLSTFIDELPNGFNSRVGELGIKMSGGQRQRIGFARAMYRNPKILILDESTSAMDYITEKELLQNLKEQRSELTVIKVAHRLKSVQDCDKIYFMDKGQIATQGTFQEIIQNNNLFKNMVLAGSI